MCKSVRPLFDLLVCDYMSCFGFDVMDLKNLPATVASFQPKRKLSVKGETAAFLGGVCFFLSSA